MKKQAFPLLLIITCIFFAFTVGLLAGRNVRLNPVEVSRINSKPIFAEKTPLSPIVESSMHAEAITFPININSSSKLELMELPGIGETLAERIMDYRTQNGPFIAPEELLNVSGIGGAKLELILDLIVAGGETP